MKIFNKQKKTIILIVTGVIVIIATGILLYIRHTHSLPAYKEAQAQRDLASLVEDVKKLIYIGDTEMPAVFTIDDPELLISQQAFFTGAEKGDSLLIYSKSSKAIIYSKKRNMIINAGPVTFDASETLGETAQVN